MNYLDLMQAIKTRLDTANPPAPALPVLRSMVMPDTESEFQRNTLGAVPLVVIAYMGSTFGKPIATDAAVLEESADLYVEISASKQTALYQALTTVRNKLLGFSPTNYKPIILEKITAAQRLDNLWRIELQFRCYAPCVPAIPEDTNDTLLNQIIFQPPTTP